MRHRLLAPLQRLEPSRAFRLTLGTAWSTDTPSDTCVSRARRGSCPRAPATRIVVQEDAPMHCPLCGFENPEGMKFCGECATPLKTRCSHYGFENPPGFKFCGECATPLAGRPPTGQPSPFAVSSPPASYTPKHLAERILAEREALEGRGVTEG